MATDALTLVGQIPASAGQRQASELVTGTSFLADREKRRRKKQKISLFQKKVDWALNPLKRTLAIYRFEEKKTVFRENDVKMKE